MKAIGAVAVSLAALLHPLCANSADPDSLTKGRMALNDFKYEAAVEYLTAAIRGDPKNTEAYILRGQAYYELTERDKALADFDRAIQLDPKSGKAFVQRGRAYFVKGDMKRAIADHTEAIRLDPKDGEPRMYRGLAYYENREYAKAVADYEWLIRTDPDSEGPLSELARCLATCPDPKVRDGKKAVEYGIKACKLNKWKQWITLEPLAAAYAEVGKFDEAVKWQKKAIELMGVDSITVLKEARRRLRQYQAGKPVRYRTLMDW